MLPAEVTQTILRSCPEWVIDSIRYLGEGDFSTAYAVNGAWVFRFAKHDQARASLKREVCLLPRLAGHITLQIPSPQIDHLDDTRAPFVAHPLLPGSHLSQADYLRLDDACRTRCAEQVAEFLTEMHSVDFGVARSCGIPDANFAARYSRMLAQAQEKLFAIIEEPERSFIERIIESYLQSGNATTARPALLHGDLSPEHILFDERTKSVNAIIDFGDMMIADPAWDFTFIYEDYGLDFLSRVLASYNEPDHVSLLHRIYYFYLLDAIDWAVDCLLDDDPALPEAIEQLRKMRVEETEQLERLLSACRGA